MNEVALSENFETRLKNRIKDSIGELMTDEDLKKILDATVHDALFSPVVTKNKDRWGSVQEATTPPLVESLVREYIQPIVKDYIDKYLNEHPELVKEKLDEVIHLGIGNVMINALTDKFRTDLYNFQMNVQSKL